MSCRSIAIGEAEIRVTPATTQQVRRLFLTRLQGYLLVLTAAAIGLSAMVLRARAAGRWPNPYVALVVGPPALILVYVLIRISRNRELASARRDRQELLLSAPVWPKFARKATHEGFARIFSNGGLLMLFVTGDSLDAYAFQRTGGSEQLPLANPPTLEIFTWRHLIAEARVSTPDGSFSVNLVRTGPAYQSLLASS